jgi:hypothetical protein
MYYLMDLERTVGGNRASYWKRNKHGYTNDITEAGLFPEEEAKHIVESDFNKRTVMIPENVVKDILKY